MYQSIILRRQRVVEWRRQRAAEVAGDIDQPAELAASPGSDVVPAAFSDRCAATLLVADGLVIVAIIADMVMKPFSG